MYINISSNFFLHLNIRAKIKYQSAIHFSACAPSTNLPRDHVFFFLRFEVRFFNVRIYEFLNNYCVIMKKQTENSDKKQNRGKSSRQKKINLVFDEEKRRYK